jgi:predicted pyridoxine 5'-phosphate oxidase superfamily flavin-nucleotide-binding protein
MNRRALILGSLAVAGAAGTGRALRGTSGEPGFAVTGTVTIGTPTPVPTPDDPGLCGSPTMRRRLIRMRIANLRAEIAQLRAALDDCE